MDPLSHGNVIPEGEVVDCFVSISYGDPYVYSGNAQSTTTMRLPSYPDSISDSIKSIWGVRTIIGRTSPISAFAGTDEQSVSFSFKMYRDMRIPVKSGEVQHTVDEVITFIRSGLYPRYTTSGLYPPVTTFKFGDFVVKGKLDSVAINWQPPIVEGSYRICEVSISLLAPSVRDGRVLDATDIMSAEVPTNPFRIDLMRS